MANVTNIPAPRVPFIDDRTGLMSREWYRFFLNLFVLTGSGTTITSLTDVQVAPDISASIAQYDEAMKYVYGLQMEPVTDDGNETMKSICGLQLEPVALPQNTIIEQSNTVMAWLSVQ